jgi:hypothetical protein
MTGRLEVVVSMGVMSCRVDIYIYSFLAVLVDERWFLVLR